MPLARVWHDDSFPTVYLLAGTSGVSVDEGWDTEDIEIPEEDLLSSDAKALMEEAKAGNVEELQVPNKVDPLCQVND